LAGRRHGGACDTCRGRDDNYQLVYLGSKFVSRDPPRVMSALPPKADITERDGHVR
jgi:hypothetical protein